MLYAGNAKKSKDPEKIGKKNENSNRRLLAFNTSTAP
jgi:hypothetical protein